MKPDFNKLLKKHQTHSTLLDENAVLNALDESYRMGKKHSEGEFEQLKEAFESLLYEYTHTCRLKKATTLVIEDWEKKGRNLLIMKDDMTVSSLKGVIVLIVLFCIWLVVSNTRKTFETKNLHQAELSKVQHICDSLQKAVDSLHAENYPCQIELNRYQIAYEILVRRNPQAAKQYGDIISNETE